MKIAIVAPSPIPFGPGGAEALWAGLYHELRTSSPHEVELIKVPIRETTLPEVMAAYETFAGLDLSHFDMVISGKYPAWMVRHPRHVVYLLHPLRGLYDSYHHFALPDAVESAEPVVRRLLDREASLHAGALPELFDRWRVAVDALGADHPDLAFPGPLARRLVHGLDRVALSPRAITRHAAISRTVAQRQDYFPDGVPVRVVHPPSDLQLAAPRRGEYFFTASRHDGPKRLDLLIEGMRHYEGSRRLLIAGSGPETPRLQELAAHDPRVRFVGRVSAEELADHYARAVGVPFVPADEDLGLITVEALGSGKPVLTTTDSGGPAEFVVPGHSGVVVPPTPESIGAGLGALERLAASPGVEDAARGAVRRVTWSRVVEALVTDPAPRRPRATRPSGRPQLAVTSTFPLSPPRNGGQLRAFHLYGALAATYDVDVVCLAAPGTPPSTTMIRPGLTEHVVPRRPEHEAEEMAVTREVGVPVTDIVAGRLTALTPEYAATLERVTSRAVGLILADPFLHPVAQQVAGGLPTVYDAYNCELVLKAQVLPDTPRGRALLDDVRAVEAGACAAAELVMTVSDEDRDNLQRLYGTPSDRFVLAPNGVDLPSVPFTALRERRRRRALWLRSLRATGAGAGIERLAVFVGSWHPPNNEAARVIVDIARQLPEVGFLLVGSHGASLRRAPLPKNVFVLGEVSDAVKTSLLASVDVALAPLTMGSGTNLKVVEYLAAGIPVVSTDVGMRGLAVPRECVRVTDLGGFAGAIRAELAGEAPTSARAERARTAVEELYDWRAIASRVLPRLATAVGRGAGPAVDEISRGA